MPHKIIRVKEQLLPRMGVGNLAVVDPELRVRGVKRLHVADATRSISDANATFQFPRKLKLVVLFQLLRKAELSLHHQTTGVPDLAQYN